MRYMSFGFFSVCCGIVAVLLVVLYLYIKKERKKMTVFLDSIPQEIKDRLENAEIKFVPSDPNAWIQEAIVIETKISGKNGNVKAAYFSKVNDRNKFDFTNIPAESQVISKRNIKTKDIIEVRLNNANEPSQLA